MTLRATLRVVSSTVDTKPSSVRVRRAAQRLLALGFVIAVQGGSYVVVDAEPELFARALALDLSEGVPAEAVHVTPVDPGLATLVDQFDARPRISGARIDGVS